MKNDLIEELEKMLKELKEHTEEIEEREEPKLTEEMRNEAKNNAIDFIRNAEEVIIIATENQCQTIGSIANVLSIICCMVNDMVYKRNVDKELVETMLIEAINKR